MRYTVMTPMMAQCEVCQDLSERSGNRDVSIKQIIETASHGCHECALLVRVLAAFAGLYEKTMHVKWHNDFQHEALEIELLGFRKQEVGGLQVFLDLGEFAHKTSWMPTQVQQH